MKNKHIFIPLFIFLGAGFVSLIASIIDFKAVNPQLSYSSETIQFDYDGASDGKDPNGNPFNAVDFLSDDIIEQALQTSELDYTVEKVRSYLTLENVVPKNIVEEIDSYTSLVGDNENELTNKDYHPVRYRFFLYSGLGLSQANSTKLLGNIVDTYCDTFLTTYSKRFNPEIYDKAYKTENYDFIYQAQVFTNKINILMEYAEQIYNEHVEFVTDKGAFRDLANKCEKLIKSDVSRIRNIVTLNALSNDLPRLKDYYTYKILRLNYDKTKNQSDLDAINAQIAGYTKDSTVYVSNGETMVKVSSNSSETYDALLDNQISLSNTIASINTEINEYTAILDDINAATGTEEEYTLVRQYLATLGKDYKEVEDIFISLLEAYNNEYVKDGIVSKSKINHVSSSLFSSAFIKRCIKVAAPIMLTVMFGISVFYLVWIIRKEKETKTA